MFSNSVNGAFHARHGSPNRSESALTRWRSASCAAISPERSTSISAAATGRPGCIRSTSWISWHWRSGPKATRMRWQNSGAPGRSRSRHRSIDDRSGSRCNNGRCPAWNHSSLCPSSAGADRPDLFRACVRQAAGAHRRAVVRGRAMTPQDCRYRLGGWLQGPVLFQMRPPARTTG